MIGTERKNSMVLQQSDGVLLAMWLGEVTCGWLQIRKMAV
jgi:hypothetical protein